MRGRRFRLPSGGGGGLVATTIVTAVLLAAVLLAATTPPAAGEEVSLERPKKTPITAIEFAPGGKSLLAGCQEGLYEFRWPTLEPLRKVATSLANIHDLSFSPHAKERPAGRTGGDAATAAEPAAGSALLAIAGGTPGDRGEIEVLSWPDRKQRWSYADHDDLVYHIAWSPNARHLAAASGDRTARVVDAKGGRAKFTGHSKAVLAVAYLDQRWLVTAGRDRSVRLWDLDQKRLRRTFDNHTADVRDLAPRPQTEGLPMIASAGADGTVRLWQPTIGRLVRFAQLPSPPLAIAWTPDGGRLCAACVDGRLRVVDPDTVEILADHAAVDRWAYAVAVASDGRSAAVGGWRGQLVRVPLGRQLR